MKKILVVRNDKIGDFMLAWPSFAMLKQSLPHAEIVALVPRYTQDLAIMCPWIDKVIVDTQTKEDFNSLVTTIKNERFDAAIALFSNSYNAKLLWKAKIPYRLAPATKLAQLLYNHKLRQRRSQSAKPEYEYNLDLIRHFLAEQRVVSLDPKAPYLTFSKKILTEQKASLAQSLSIDVDKQWCFIHAGTGGSANNLSLQQYAQLIELLSKEYPDFVFVLTAGPDEAEKAQQLCALLPNAPCVIYDKNSGICDFATSIACADLFIAGSTGPLHIAAAIDVPTIGFFPSKRSATPLRWQPLNSPGNHLAFSPPQTKNEQDDLTVLDIEEVMKTIKKWIKK